MMDMILLRLAHLAMWSPLLLLHFWQAYKARRAGATSWEQHHMLLAQLWMAVAVITGEIR